MLSFVLFYSGVAIGDFIATSLAIDYTRVLPRWWAVALGSALWPLTYGVEVYERFVQR